MSDFENEWQKMLRGEVYEAAHPRFLEMLVETRQKIAKFNSIDPADMASLRGFLKDLLGSIGENSNINQPFRCDYGCNIHIGHDTLINFNLTVLDEATVTIGNHVLIGPNVSIYTACHPLDAETRDTFVEWAEPVTIGDSVWVGGGATFCPGVTVGEGAVVAAGSVVVHDVPPYTLVAGNPAKPKRSLRPDGKKEG